VSTEKVKIPRKEVLALAREVDEIYATKGRALVHVNLKKDKPSAATLLELLLGRTGNLRAPVLRLGRKLIVGFDEATYNKYFK
jgi:arsenate reductase-like glutaredoxin family protein